MYRLVPMLMIVALFAGCAPKTMTPEQKSREEKAIGTLITEFWKSYGSKNWAAMNKLFTDSGDFVCFGTDSSRATQAPWQASGYERAFTPAVPGDFENVSIQFLDGAGELASVFCELKVDMTMEGKLYHAVARYAAVTKKENGEWHILRSMASFPSPPVLAEQVSTQKEQSSCLHPIQQRLQKEFAHLTKTRASSTLHQWVPGWSPGGCTLITPSV